MRKDYDESLNPLRMTNEVPGYGAQGGKAADIAQYMNNSNGGVVNSSRGILLAYKKQPGVAFDEAAYNECVRMKEDIQGECNKL